MIHDADEGRHSRGPQPEHEGALDQVQRGHEQDAGPDAEQGYQRHPRAAEGPFYMRTSRAPFPVLTQESDLFQIGKANILRDGKDVAIIGCGMLLYNALVAAEELAGEGTDCMVINSHTVKPIDEKTIAEAAQKTGAVVSVEEHQVNGGLGSAVAEVLSKNYPVPQEYIGVQDRFGESGNPDELIEAFEMGVGSIKEAVKRAILRKK